MTRQSFAFWPRLTECGSAELTVKLHAEVCLLLDDKAIAAYDKRGKDSGC